MLRDRDEEAWRDVRVLLGRRLQAERGHLQNRDILPSKSHRHVMLLRRSEAGRRLSDAALPRAALVRWRATFSPRTAGVLRAIFFLPSASTGVSWRTVAHA